MTAWSCGQTMLLVNFPACTRELQSACLNCYSSVNVQSTSSVIRKHSCTTTHKEALFVAMSA